MSQIRALQMLSDKDLALCLIASAAAARSGRGSTAACSVVSINHIDVFGLRGMAFAKRLYPLSVGAGSRVRGRSVGERRKRTSRPEIASFRSLPTPAASAAQCLRHRDNHCENVLGIRGFHVDGWAQEVTNHPARLMVKIPDGVSMRDAACVGVAYSTVEHMLFDNAQLEPGETILVQAGGSGIGSIAVKVAKSLGCTVIATAGGLPEKAARVKALGADHVIDYRTERFEGVTRKLTGRKGVDVVFEHVGADTWQGSLLCLKRGGRLVTCGATSGPSATINLMQLFQQQYRIIGSFGSPISALSRALDRIAGGVGPVIDTVYPLEDFRAGVQRLADRDVFGKILVEL